MVYVSVLIDCKFTAVHVTHADNYLDLISPSYRYFIDL